MNNYSRDIAIRKIKEMPKDQVSKVLIFMAGMEAEYSIMEKNEEHTNTERKEKNVSYV